MKIFAVSCAVLFLFFSRPAVARPGVGETAQKVKDRFVADGVGVRVEVWIENLEIPWSLVFLRGGRALASERPGRIRLVKDGKLIRQPYAEVEVAYNGEGGLMGLALQPDCSS